MYRLANMDHQYEMRLPKEKLPPAHLTNRSKHPETFITEKIQRSSSQVLQKNQKVPPKKEQTLNVSQEKRSGTGYLSMVNDSSLLNAASLTQDRPRSLEADDDEMAEFHNWISELD